MKMKKLLALLLALSLCMVCFTAFAEEAAEDEEEITAITNTVSYEGVEVSLADMGLVFLLPLRLGRSSRSRKRSVCLRLSRRRYHHVRFPLLRL